MYRFMGLVAAFLAFGGIGMAQTQDLVLPVVLNGYVKAPIHYQTTLRIVNLSATAEVSLISAPVGPHPICLRPSTDIITTAQVPAIAAATKLGGVAVIRPNRTSGYAIVNPSTTQTATAYLSLLDPRATLVGSATVVIPPQGRVSRMLSEYFPGATSDLMGSIRITASSPVAAGALNILFPEGKLVSLAVQPLPAGICAQVIAPARNPLTNECVEFPTPCNVPEGWLTVQSCGQ